MPDPDETDAEPAAASPAIVATPPVPAVESGDSWFAGKLLFWIPPVPLVALDLWSKAWAFDYVTGTHLGRFSTHNEVGVFQTGWIDLDLVTWLNPGTIWGLGAEYHVYLKYFRILAIGLIVYFAYRTVARHRSMLFSLSLILAGALGNLYDNFLHHDPAYSRVPQFAGAVRDFLRFHNDSPEWNFPAFNVADSCITVGAILLFLLLWRSPATGGVARAEKAGS